MEMGEGRERSGAMMIASFAIAVDRKLEVIKSSFGTIYK